MKKMMLGLVVVVMMLAMVGCGEDTTPTEKENVTVENSTEQESEVNTEVKVDINGNVIVETETIEEEKQVYVLYAVIKQIDLNTKDIKLDFYREDGSLMFSKRIPYEERFDGMEDRAVKVSGYGSEYYLNEIISVEIVEE